MAVVLLEAEGVSVAVVVLLLDEPEVEPPVTGMGRSITTPATEPICEPFWPFTCMVSSEDSGMN